ncbi:hypothetical protein RB200_25280 [Streptomyces sp. PmtG]
MSFEEEWGEARNSAAEHHTAQARLNQVSGEGGKGKGAHDLVVRRDDLGRIGNDAYKLIDGLQRKGNLARASTFSAAIALTNKSFRTGSALLTVHDTWNSQLRTLLDACANISNHLDYSKAAHAKDEDDIIAAMSASRISKYFR